MLRFCTSCVNVFVLTLPKFSQIESDKRFYEGSNNPSAGEAGVAHYGNFFCADGLYDDRYRLARTLR